MFEIKLLEVLDTFQIDKGRVLVGVAPPGFRDLNEGEPIRIIKTDGNDFETRVMGFDRFTKCFTDLDQVAILISSENPKTEVTIASEVWVSKTGIKV